MKQGQIRIISGHLRGRKIPVLDSDGLRPTTDRVKETLFNWLQADIKQSRCLDLFAGSGSLGLEALSRGAAHVTFIEKSSRASKQLNAVCQSLSLTNVDVINQDALAFLENNITPFDIIFIDPPFHHDWLNKILNTVTAHLNPNGLLYIETEQAHPNLPETLSCYREKNTGSIKFGLYSPHA